MKRRTISLLIYLSVFAVLVLGCRGCPPRTDGPVFNGDSSPVAGVSPTPSRGTGDSVKRVEANVMAGESQPLPLLNDDNPHDLLARMQVSTDPNGEALLKLSGCAKVYVFQKSSITYAPCSKSESGTNFRCQTDGTAVYNSECAGRIKQVIQTPTQDISPKGTWFSVTYLPNQELTITLVMKGSVEIRPVINMESRTLGEPVLVSEGQTYATVPEKPGQEDFGHLAELRRVKPAAEMPDGLKASLEPWLDKIAKRAESDGISFDRNAFSLQQSMTTSQSTWPVDCDCGHVNAGLLTKQYYEECLRKELALIDEYRRTGRVNGTCNSVAQGPNARPKG